MLKRGTCILAAALLLAAMAAPVAADGAPDPSSVIECTGEASPPPVEIQPVEVVSPGHFLDLDSLPLAFSYALEKLDDDADFSIPEHYALYSVSTPKLDGADPDKPVTAVRKTFSATDDASAQVELTYARRWTDATQTQSDSAALFLDMWVSAYDSADGEEQPLPTATVVNGCAAFLTADSLTWADMDRDMVITLQSAGLTQQELLDMAASIA